MMRQGVQVLWLMVVAALLGCDPPQPPQDSALDTEQTPRARIVTLAPALTKMIVDLGQGDLLVGVGQFDDAAPEALPTVGHFMDVNTEALFTLKPTHVLMMTGQGGVPEVLETLKMSMGFELIAWPYPYSVAEAANILYDERERFPQTPGLNASQSVRPSLGTILGMPDQAWKLKTQMLQKLANIDHATDGSDRPLTLAVISLQGGVMAAGPGSVFDSLFAFVGALNAVADEKNSAPVLDREKLLAAQPEMILLMLPNGQPLSDVATDPRISIFRGLDIPAVKNGRFAVINDPLVHLPATNLPDIAAQMAKAIHPDRTEAIDAALHGASPVTHHESP